eukprot:SM000343S12833  [mRNA]  locus=s343:79784:80626:- [translate_table: standard]
MDRVSRAALTTALAMSAVMHETPTTQVVAAMEVARQQELEVAAAMHAHRAAMEAAEAARHGEPLLPAPRVLEGTVPNETQPPQPPPATLATNGGGQCSASAELSSPLSSEHAPSHLDLKLLNPLTQPILLAAPATAALSSYRWR